MSASTKHYAPEGAITLSEARRRLGLSSPSHLNTLINAGDIQVFWLTRRWVVESSVTTYLEKKRGIGHGTEERRATTEELSE